MVYTYKYKTEYDEIKIEEEAKQPASNNINPQPNLEDVIQRDPKALHKLQELDRILHKGEMVAKNVQNNNIAKHLRSQSVGGIGAIGSMQEAELRNVA